MSTRRSLNRSVKSFAGWGVVLAAFVVLMAVGITREPAPRTSGDRIDEISKRIACPTCDGESVYESRATASESIRAEITSQVNAGNQTDDQIIEFLADRFGGQVLLVPRATGIEALAWAIPVAVGIVAIAGLFVAFRRWRNEAVVAATDADRELVDEAMMAQRRPADLDSVLGPDELSPGASDDGDGGRSDGRGDGRSYGRGTGHGEGDGR
jgi:cytochrome c-type biogenesis protein CcmH